MTQRPARAAVGPVRALGLAAVAGLLVACGASPAPLAPTGTDGLTIPTPSPDPADFVAHVDNPWFPLAPGTVWTYRRYTTLGSQVLTATVLAAPHRVAGVDTTAVRWDVRAPHRRTTRLSVRWYAQDAAGNVWWFGQRVFNQPPQVDLLATRSWSAGVHGARAGLLVAAAPRVGDGYLNGLEPAVVERRSTVVSVDATVALPRRDYHHTLSTLDLSTLEPTREVRSFFASGIGLVAQQTTEAVSIELSLVRVRRP
jgi:hypothetical protein